MPPARAELAPAKVNLTLQVVGRRADGYHEIVSLVVFAGLGDTLTFTPADALALSVSGPTAAASGELGDNLVLKAANALAARVEGLTLGRFLLSKRLPVAAGVGGGSSDAAATLRLLARANDLALDDPRVVAAARVTGADVPVCLDPRPRVMRGIGDVLSEPLALPRLPAVLVNPRVAVPTKDVFAKLQLVSSIAALSAPSALMEEGRGGGTPIGLHWSDVLPKDPTPSLSSRARGGRTAFLAALAQDRNDLEAPAISLQPVIADVLQSLRALTGCRLARMSGSGATCFALFETKRAAEAAARTLRGDHPWWVRATMLG